MKFESLNDPMFRILSETKSRALRGGYGFLHHVHKRLTTITSVEIVQKLIKISLSYQYQLR